MKKVKPEEVLQAMLEKDIASIDIRPCSICGHVLTYKRIAYQLYIDTNCDCVSYVADLKPKSFNAISDWLNRANEAEAENAPALFKSVGLDIADYAVSQA
jgi:hypothetical protein